MILSLAVSVLVVALYLWQDGAHGCPDGTRYTSKKAQPTPFHRRWCGWNAKVLTGASLLGLVFVSSMLGSWWQAALFVTLPGAWFIATRPTTVDGPSMALAWGSALLFPRYPYAAVALSACSGFVHERGPVFAALYSWSPWPLLGLVASGWWRKPAPRDSDPWVGHAKFLEVVSVHRKAQDWLDFKAYAFATRGLIPIAALCGAPPSAWAAMAVATASRVVATDNSRIVIWGAPALIVALRDVPQWAIAVHCMTFIRMF